MILVRRPTHAEGRENATTFHLERVRASQRVCRAGAGNSEEHRSRSSTRVRIVSPSGNPVPQACVRESWQNYNLHEPLHSEEVVADSSGRVVFAVRAMRSSRLRELLGMMQNIVHNPAHFSHGNETLVMAWAPGMEGELGGPGMVLRPEVSRLSLVPTPTTQPPCRPGTAP